ncbi:MAG: glycosyltransferase, partial [Lentisphaeraceae bacterium]|nr:glycosyltransferase [Lentisphaeraceae bacterium]
MNFSKQRILTFNAEGVVIPHTLADVQMTLRNMGHEVLVIDLPSTPNASLAEIAILDSLLLFQPDVVMTIDNVGIVPEHYLFICNQTKIVSWFYDAPQHFLDKSYALLGDRYFAFCWDRAYEDVVKSFAVNNFIYLPLATNPLVYAPLKTSYKYDVSFVGTWSEKREKFLRNIADKGVVIDLFGNEKWLEIEHDNIHFHGFADNRRECPDIYRSSKINLNITNEQLLTSLPLRIFDVGACCGFVLCDYQEDASTLFDGSELCLYRDENDLPEKIKFYLKNEEERRVVALSLYKRVMKEYTFEKALSKVFKYINIVKDYEQVEVAGVVLERTSWESSLCLISNRYSKEALPLLQYALAELPSSLKLRMALAVALKISGNSEQAESLVLSKTESLRAH